MSAFLLQKEKKMKRIQIEEKLEALVADCLKQHANYGDIIYALHLQMKAVEEAAKEHEAQRQ